MKVTYGGPALVYRWPKADGSVAGEMKPGEEGTVPDEILAGSLRQKGNRHIFYKSDGSTVQVSDLSKSAQEVAARVEAQRERTESVNA